MSNASASDSPAAQGTCDKRFDAVREAFTHNLAQSDETGAAVCLRVAGRTVVDLWGGFADQVNQTPWQRDTLVNSYSVGKGILSILVLALANRGVLDLDLRVADVWPEFAAEGKQDIRLPTMLCHAAGLPAVRERLPEGAMLDWGRMCEALADQAPYWVPGRRHGYHSATFGYLVGEVIRRRTGLLPGEALRETLTGPLDADFGWGLDASALSRVATVHSVAADAVVTEERWPLAFPATGDEEADRMRWHAYFNPSGLSGGGIANTPAWRRAQVPSANGHGTARGIARLYDVLREAERGRSRVISRELVERARTIHADGEDAVLQRPTRFGLGFQLNHAARPLGRTPGAFGHYGYGGSLGFVDPECDFAFGYVRNQPGDRWRTPRTLALVDAVYESLGVG